MAWLHVIGMTTFAVLASSAVEIVPAHAQAGSSQENEAITLNERAYVLFSQGKFDQAEALLRTALAMNRTALGENHPDTAMSYNNLAFNLEAQERYSEAEPLHRNALKIRRSRLGENHKQTTESYNNLIFNLEAQGRYGEAEPLYRMSLSKHRALLGDNHPDIAGSYSSLAANLSRQGRNIEAELLFHKALDISRLALGEDHQQTAMTYNNFASNLDDQGRHIEAEPLYHKALDINLSVLGEHHQQTAAAYNNVAFNLQAQARYGEAELLYRKALEISLAILGENHQQTASAYNNLASVLNKLGQYNEAERLLRKALDIRRAVFGENHLETAASYNNVAFNLGSQGRYGEAEILYSQVLDISRKVLGENHQQTAASYNNLAFNMGSQHRYGEAEIVSAKAVESARRARLIGEGEKNHPRSGTNAGAPNPVAFIYSQYLYIAAELAAVSPQDENRLQANAFRTAQDIIGSASAQAMADAAVRASAGSDALAAVAREEQDLVALVRQINRALLAALGRGDASRTAQLSKDYEAALGKLALVDAKIDKDFPTYRELISPKPLDLAEAQKALTLGEGLLVLVEGDDAVYSFAVTPEAVAWGRVDGDAKDILKQVATLRCDVDMDSCSEEQIAALEALPLTNAEVEGFRRFDLVTANALYGKLISPIESALEGASKLYVTSSGSLGDLPLGMLVTAAPAAGADLADPATLLNAKWLSDRYALTTLPAVSALRLRAMAKTGVKPSTEFRGYGNPVLAPPEERDQEIAPKKADRRGGSYYRGAGDDGIRLGDPEQLRSLPSLPGTKTELEAMAGLYGIGLSDLNMGLSATETAIKNDALLKQANVIAFATHGLLPSPGRGMDEPGLVFTPPLIATKDDDGILTASEASQLSFLADWVILSACNTASTASGAGGSDSLSALARAFLYAGAHALLASHWQVSDKATAALTVETLTARRDNPNLTRAQALQLAMHAVRTGKRSDGKSIADWDESWAHPSIWAPFSHIANSDE
jgi:CHAT domain-containing protein/tetratricopeptide (TPR) repeat protein